jgi:hypothetical protein
MNSRATQNQARSVVHIRIRLAQNHDVPVLREWIAASVWRLQAGDYSTAQLEHAVQALLQELFCLIFEFLEHHAVAILGMTGYDASPYDGRVPVEPEGGLNGSADGEGHHQLDVAAGVTEVGGAPELSPALQRGVEWNDDASPGGTTDVLPHALYGVTPNSA